ncbi:MAG: hypothetical protein HW388_1550 [Dehalococcoidia bacterium]|nr:hypothetical protein [Dehalococcoidia bacterium]
MIRRLLRDEKGAALIIVLAFIALAVPLVTGALGLASTLSIDSRIKTRAMKSTYATIGGLEHLVYRLVYEDGYAETLPLGQATNYVITINGIDVTITVTKTNEPPPPDAVPPGLSNRSFSISKSVYPTAVSPDTQTTYIYTVLLSNMTENEKTITQVKDDFPEGLSYVPGSTSGLTTSDPAIVSGDLRWNVTSEEGTLPPFSTRGLQFQMQGLLTQGVYCNDIWVNPGGDKTRSGKTAKITVGSPASTLCPGTAIKLSKTVSPQMVPSDTLITFTYTITLTSNGTDSSEVSKVIDILPADFSYVSGSTQGLTTVDPSILLVNNGTQEKLTWSANPIGTIPPGETRGLTFQTTATPLNASYYNEVTVTMSGLNYDLYSWPTAKVEVVGVFQMGASDGETSTDSDVWLTNDGAFRQEWGVSTH